MIKNLDVTFEIVSAKNIDVNEFYFTSPEVKEIEVIDPQFVVSEPEQIAFTFDLPIQKVEETINTDRLVFDLTNEIRDIKVTEAVEFVPVTEITQNGVIKHSLEEYMEVENQLFEAKKAAEVVVEPTPEELNITMKHVEARPQMPAQTFTNEISPVDMSIDESLKLRAEERRRKMKEFNYKFHNNAARVDEFEKEPAYKRMGIDISNNPIDNSRSRMSLGLDSNDDVQLRSNNSFLHDNVD